MATKKKVPNKAKLAARKKAAAAAKGAATRAKNAKAAAKANAPTREEGMAGLRTALTKAGNSPRSVNAAIKKVEAKNAELIAMGGRGIGPKKFGQEVNKLMKSPSGAGTLGAKK